VGTCLAVPTFAQDEAAPAEGYLGDFLQDFDGAAGKLLQLAEAMSEEHYAYAVSEEVRNFGQVLVHVAGANFFLSRALGVEPPEAMSPDMEATITSKQDIVALLKTSHEHVRKAVAMTSAADLENEVEIFGGKRTVRGVFLIIAGHNHEHLGQGIAYARGAGVAPPWSQGG
jgi:uncharacterized damage-inducible protein DinB